MARQHLAWGKDLGHSEILSAPWKPTACSLILLDKVSMVQLCLRFPCQTSLGYQSTTDWFALAELLAQQDMVLSFLP